MLGLVARIIRPTSQALTLLDRFLRLHSELVESHSHNVRAEPSLARNGRTHWP
ncbi:hypothetical protein DB31_0538 [Hyalangium minutum]|uniref:Uncharacterized protein n=1 Tax=Hyalangium minutum TaxID=394096 RepID=A0A085WX63_9BACT|nr:hypothetical protein DB31_0538 [Hyalangium minutum]